MRQFIRERSGVILVVGLMIAYSAYFSALSIQRHDTFRTHASDLGQMDQALWNTLHGHLLEDTRPEGHQAPRLTDHVEPIFLVVPFVYLIYDGVEAILVLQSIAIALGALPLFWIARRNLRNEWAAIGFAAMYLLFPALEAANLAEFHAVTFAPAPLLFAYHYAGERAWRRFALFALIALMVKEEIALLVFAMAAWFAVKELFQVPGVKLLNPRTWGWKRMNVYPATFALLSLVWFFVAVFVIVPRFSPGGRSVYIGRYACVTQALKDWRTAIPQVIGCVLIPEKIAYVLQLLASAGFIAVLDPIALLIGSPSLMLNLLSSYEAQYSGTYHYSAPVAPYIVLAAIAGTSALADFLARLFPSPLGDSKGRVLDHHLSPSVKAGGSAAENPQGGFEAGLSSDSTRWQAMRGTGNPRALAVALVPAFVIALGYHALAGYTPVGGQFFWPELNPHHQLFARFADQIPRAVPASTDAALFPHLSHRRVLYRFRQGPIKDDLDYILLDVSQAAATNPYDYRIRYLDVLKQGFGIRDAADGYILLQRGLTKKDLPDSFYDFLRAPPGRAGQPQQRVVVDFDDKVRFLGFDVRQDDWQRVYLRTYWTRLPGMDNNFALFPFFPRDDGAPRGDAALPPLTVHFWYPTMNWKEGEVVVADTLPIDVGPRARIGIGVFFGAEWDDASFYLTPHTSAQVSPEGRWVLVGEIARQGKRYEVVK